jgi:hypothetical protein
MFIVCQTREDLETVLNLNGNFQSFVATNEAQSISEETNTVPPPGWHTLQSLNKPTCADAKMPEAPSPFELVRENSWGSIARNIKKMQKGDKIFLKASNPSTFYTAAKNHKVKIRTNKTTVTDYWMVTCIGKVDE